MNVHHTINQDIYKNAMHKDDSKRQKSAADVNNVDEGSECEEDMYDLKKTLASIESEMRKSIMSKKKQVSSFNKNYNSQCEKLSKISADFLSDKSKITQEFDKQMNLFIDQLEAESEAFAHEESKIHHFLKQRAEQAKECQAIQQQRVKKMKLLQEQYVKSLTSLDKIYQSNVGDQTSLLKDEVATLQSKIIRGAQARDLEKMKRNFMGY